MTNIFSNKDILAIKDMIANKDMMAVKDMLVTTAAGIAAAKILKSPAFVKGTIGGVALIAAGYTYMQLSNSKRGLQLRKKIATAIRDKAQKAVDTFQTVEELEKVAMEEK